MSIIFKNELGETIGTSSKNHVNQHRDIDTDEVTYHFRVDAQKAEIGHYTGSEEEDNIEWVFEKEYINTDYSILDVNLKKLLETDKVVTRQIEDMIEVFSDEQKAALPQNITDSIADKKAKRQAYIDLLTGE